MSDKGIKSDEQRINLSPSDIVFRQSTKRSTTLTSKALILVAFFCVLSNNIFSAQVNPVILDRIKDIESTTEGRLGIFALNTGNGQVVHYRADETFPTGCTSKVIGVAAVLKKSMSEPSILMQLVQYSQKDLALAGYTPITEKHVSEGMNIKELCAASISYSDNAAMNLLLKSIDGIQGMNEFARTIGDVSFRQDNDWPAEAYSGGEGSLNDSSTPRAMVESFKKLTIGEILDRPQRDMFIAWLIDTKTGAKRIRSAIPNGWIVGNKTGTGGSYGTTNDLAIIWPPKHAPILLGIYYTSHKENAISREDILCDITKLIIEEFTSSRLF